MSERVQVSHQGRVAISVIVPAYNASDTIENCIDSIIQQVVDCGYEIILVDNGSSDNTIELAQKFSGVKIVDAPRLTVYGARNKAVAESCGEVLAFTDSDCIADPYWLQDGLSLLENCDIVSGNILPQDSKSQVLYYYEKFVFRAKKEPGSRAVNIAGGNAIIRRDVFEGVGGFDAALVTAGDSIFSTKARHLGFETEQARRCIVYHPVDGYLKRFQWAFREGEGSMIKSAHLKSCEAQASKLKAKVGNMVSDVFRELGQIREARKEGAFGCLMAARVVTVTVGLRILAYLGVIVARYMRPLQSKLARR